MKIHKLFIVLFAFLSMNIGPFASASGSNHEKLQYFPKHDQYWKFHTPTKQEQQAFSSVLPQIEGYIQPKAVDAVSQSLSATLNEYDETKVYSIIREGIKLKIRILKYHLTEDRNNGQLKDFYQIVMTEENGQVFRSDIIMKNASFRLFPYAIFKGAYSLKLSSLESDSQGGAVLRIHNIAGKTDPENNHDHLINVPGFQMSEITDYIQLEDFTRVFFLGKPTNGPFGLYSLWGEPSSNFIKAFPQTIPGFEASSISMTDSTAKPLQSARKILGVYQNSRGIFALLNNLEGIIVVNVETGESKQLYQIPEQDSFATVMNVIPPRGKSRCTQLTVGVYKNSQGPAFYNSLNRSHSVVGTASPVTAADAPLSQVNIGLTFNSTLFYVDTDGCESDSAEK